MNAHRELDRAIVYRTLAHLLQPPCAETLGALRAGELDATEQALQRLEVSEELVSTCRRVREELARRSLEDLTAEWDRTFEPTGGLSCSPHETAHTAKTPQEAWLKTYRMADVAGFYRAFGVEVRPGTEKPDHVGVELEFLHLLAVKAAAALERGEAERAEICREAAAAFLDEHLGAWAGELPAALAEAEPHGFYVLAAELVAGFVEGERERSEAFSNAIRSTP